VRHEKLDRVRLGERIRVPCMIVVLVGDEDSAQRRGRDAEPFEPALQFLGPEPAIEQQPRRARLDDYAVSLGAAAGAGEPNCGALTSAVRAGA
jgi:hypothetical protein